MASTTTSTPLSLSSSSALNNAKASQGVALPVPPQPASVHSFYSTTHLTKTTVSYRKIARRIIAKATGEAAPAVEVVAAVETPEFVKTIQEAWDKLDDKYAFTSLAVAGGVALWGCAGMISAIDKLPLIPGILELVGIGYTGWFAYQNLIFKPDRDALFEKIKCTYKEIIGSS